MTTKTNTTDNQNEVIGYRFIAEWDVDEPPKIGDRLDHSYRWEGDERTDDELGGTCAFETREDIEEYTAYSRGCGWIVTITGELAGWGELPGEIIVRDATVTEVEEI